MRITRMGEGSPTILLDAGWGHWSAIWALVQPKLAEKYTTVSFDHMGLGGSDPGPWPRSSFQIVDEIQSALAAASIRGPFVYVAHSFSAVHARTFAYRQEDAIGMVLVDPVVEALGVSKYFRQLRDETDRQFARWLMPSRFGILAAKNFLFRTPPFAKRLPKEAAREFRYGYKPDVIKTIRGEFAALDESLKQLAGLGTPKVPFEVLSASEDWLPGTKTVIDGETRVQAMHRKFAAAVRGGRHRVVPNSSHHIHIDQPDAVVTAVEDLLARA
jgi:pimeloyl-ACP methyl ester carboxylesterase